MSQLTSGQSQRDQIPRGEFRGHRDSVAAELRGGVTRVMDDLDETYVSIETCAERMGLSVGQVMDLVSSHVLKARRWGAHLFEVQPAIVPGITTPARRKRRGNARG